MISALLVIPIFSVNVSAAEVSTSAGAYVLYCANNGEIIASHNENEKMKMASTTKIMTTLLTLEEAASNDRRVMFTKDMVAEGSSMYLGLGEVVMLSDLASGMMMASGNDAANAAAITISGSIEDFAELMNNRAKQIGMTSTHFVTPSGLDDDEHYSTAYDMALLMAYALENEQFANVTSQKSISIQFQKPSEKKNTYQNHNKLLSMYEYCIGGKTGYTKSAGRCLVSASKKDGLTLIAVTLSDPDDWDDHIALYNYGFDKYSAIDTDDSDADLSVDIVGGTADNIKVYSEYKPYAVVSAEDADKVVREVYLPQFVYAPVKKGEQVGMVVYSLDGKVVSQNPLYAEQSVDVQKNQKTIFDYIKELF